MNNDVMNIVVVIDLLFYPQRNESMLYSTHQVLLVRVVVLYVNVVCYTTATDHLL